MSFYPVYEKHQRTQEFTFKHIALDMKATKAEWSGFVLKEVIDSWVNTLPLEPVGKRIAFICIAQRYLREVRA